MKDLFRQLGLFSSILGILFGSSLVGVGVGYGAWKYLGAPGWVFFLSSVIGLAAGFYKIYEISKREFF